MHQDLLKKIQSRFFLLTGASIILILSGFICMIFISDKYLCGCISILGFFLLYVSISKYGWKTKENTYAITAECTGKSRTGYRKQYLEYSFKTEDGKSFEIKTAQKEKFKVGLKYNMCFKKEKNKESEQLIYGANLILFELI